MTENDVSYTIICLQILSLSSTLQNWPCPYALHLLPSANSPTLYRYTRHRKPPAESVDAVKNAPS